MQGDPRFLTSDRCLDDLPGVCGQGVINFVKDNKADRKDFKKVDISQYRNFHYRPTTPHIRYGQLKRYGEASELESTERIQADVQNEVGSAQQDPEAHSPSAKQLNMPEKAKSKPSQVLYQARYVQFRKSPEVSTSLKRMLDSWDLSGYSIIFVYQSDSRDLELFARKLVKSMQKAKRCGMKLACVIFDPKGFGIKDDVFSEFRQKVPCIKLLCELEDNLGIQRDVDVNHIGFSDTDSNSETEAQFSRWPFYIMTMFDSYEFLSLAIESCLSVFSIVYGDVAKAVNKQQVTSMSKLLSSKCARTCLHICSGYDIEQQYTSIPIQSLTDESLFLLIADEFAFGELSKKVLTDLAKKKRALVKAGPLLSKPVATTLGGVANIQFCTTYSVMKAKAEGGVSPFLPTYITKNFDQNDIVVAIYLSDLGSDKAKLRDPLAKMLIHILDRLNNERSGKILNFIFDTNACLFASSQSSVNVKKNAEDTANQLCVGVIPLSQITNAQGWDPKDGQIDMFPLCDSNGCVDKYIIVDDCDTWPMRVDQSDMCNMVLHGICDSMVLFNNRSGQNNVVIALTMKATDQLEVVIGDRLNDPTYCYKFDLSNDDTKLVEEAILHSLPKDSTIKPEHAVRLARYMNKETKCRKTLDGDKSLLVKLVKSVVDRLVTVMKPPENTRKSESTTSITEMTEQLSRLMLELGDSDVGELIRLSDTFRKYLRGAESQVSKDEEVETVIFSNHCNKHFAYMAASALIENGKEQQTISDDNLKSLLTMVPGDPIAGFVPVLAHMARISDLYALLMSSQRRNIVPYALYSAGVLRYELQHGKFRSVSNRERIKYCADDLELHAREIIHNVYLQDKQLSQSILSSSPDGIIKHSTFSLAKMAEAKKFLSDQACKASLQDKWWGILSTLEWYYIFPYVCLPCFLQASNTPKKILPVYGPQNKDYGKDKDAWYQLYTIPAVKCMLHCIVFFIFLSLYSHMVLTELRELDEFGSVELVVHIWVLSLTIEEALQLAEFYRNNEAINGKIITLLNYYRGFWNLLDFFSVILFYIGMIIRIVAYFTGSHTALAVAHIIFATDAVVLFARSLQFFCMNENIGPLLIMVRSMFLDLRRFMLILLITLLGYGVALQSILFPYSSERGLRLLHSILYVPYFQIYGELGVHDILHSVNGTADDNAEPQYRNYVCVILAGSYLLFTNILLINLLIAMFNSTYNDVADDADYHYVMYMNDVLLEYKDKWLLPPPLIILTYIPRLFWKCCKEKEKSTDRKVYEFENEKSDFMEETVKASVVQQRQQYKETLEGISEDLNQMKAHNDVRWKQMDILSDTVHKALPKIMEDLENLHKLVKRLKPENK